MDNEKITEALFSLPILVTVVRLTRVLAHLLDVPDKRA